MGNVIVTGGAGFIGSHLVERMIEHNGIFKIYVLDNLVRSNNLRNLEHLKENSKLEFILADVSTFDYHYFDEIPISKVYHLAATRINRCSKFNFEGHNSITNGGYKIVEFCHRRDAKLFFASTASVYNKPKYFPIEEDNQKNPHTIYGAGKLYTENLIQSFDQMYGFDYTINRFFSVYGHRMDCEGAYTEVIFNWLNHLAKKISDPITIYGNPNEKVLDLVYVSDVVDAIQMTMYKTNKEIFNVSTQYGVTLAELIDMIKTVTGKTFKIQLEADGRTDIEKKRVGSTKKLRSLGWSQKVSLEQGITKTWEWISDFYG